MVTQLTWYLLFFFLCNEFFFFQPIGINRTFSQMNTDPSLTKPYRNLWKISSYSWTR